MSRHDAQNILEFEVFQILDFLGLGMFDLRFCFKKGSM